MQERARDVVVVGGGAIGLACAWRAAQAGLRVRVLERGGEPGRGASWVAAGILAPVTEAHFGEEALTELTLASAALWPGFAGELERASGLPVGYARTGTLHVALDRDELAELRRLHAYQAEQGLDATWLTPSECRRLEPGLSPAVAGGVHSAHEAQVDPRLLTAALRVAVEAAGGEVVTGADVVAALVEGERLAGVRTADGREHRAERVLLAAGCWSGALDWLPEPARPPVRPVKGQLLQLRGAADDPVCERMLWSPWIYVVPRADGRVVVGGTVEERGFDTTVTAGAVHELLREAYRLLPEVAELELVEAIAGLRPGSPDNAPLFGAGALDGLVVATGHYRNGILLTPVTAEAVARLLVEGETGWPAFAPDRFGVHA